jgi:L-threonylcarbamoyladenylate synthase
MYNSRKEMMMGEIQMDYPNRVLEPTEEKYAMAAECVRNGGIIITPSDTNAALTLNPWIDSAIEKAFAIKGRPATSPLTLFIYEPDTWCEYASAEDMEIVRKIARAFWPGPLNIVLPKKDTVPDAMLCGGDTVSRGCLKNPVWRGFMRKLGMPVAMTSANLSGQANGILVDFELALKQVGNRVDYMLKGQSDGTTMSSTILDLTGSPKILRQGDITAGAIESIIARKVQP